MSAKSGQTDNSSRDSRMHKEVLETSKYPDAIFRPTQVEGSVARSGASDVKLHGIFTLHGSDHEVIAAVHVEMSPGTWKASCKFDVPYIAWGLKDPGNFLLKVNPVVGVEMDALGTVQPAQ